MKKILILNIDKNYRSLYTLETVMSFIGSDSNTECTLIASTGCEATNSLDLFANIHLLDVEQFFRMARDYSSETLEREVKRLLTPVVNTEWDIAINLSSNQLGALLTHFLRYKKILGSFIDPDTGLVQNTDIWAFLNSKIQDKTVNYLHPAFLFQKMMGVESGEMTFPLKSENLKKRFQDLCRQSDKSGIVFIDANIKKDRNIPSLNFMIDLFLNFHQKSNLLPVLLTRDDEIDDLLTTKLRDTLAGDLHLLSANPQAHFEILGHASLIITDDLYLKTISDFVRIPSILISQNIELPISDYSITKKSLLIRTTELNHLLASTVVDLSGNVTSDTRYKIKDFGDIEIYETYLDKNLPLLRSLLKPSIEFTKWLLGVRFIAYNQIIKISCDLESSDVYQQELASEKLRIKMEIPKKLTSLRDAGLHDIKIVIEEITATSGVLFPIGLALSEFENGNVTSGKQYIENLKKIILNILQFLEQEQKPS